MILDIMMTIVGVLLIIMVSVALISGSVLIVFITVEMIFGIKPEQQQKYVKDWFARRRGGSDDS